MTMSTENTALEKRIIDAVHASLHEAIAKKFEGYNSPLDELLKRTVLRHDAQLQALLDKAFTYVTTSDSFAEELKGAFDKKLAKVLLAGFEGEIERRATKLREDPTFRAKIVLAIDAAVKSCTK